MPDSRHEELLNYHDDNRVLRDVLQSVHGASPVSGGVMGNALEEEAKSAEESTHIAEDLDFDTDAVA